jgi:hypothetical protein
MPGSANRPQRYLWHPSFEVSSPRRQLQEIRIRQRRCRRSASRRKVLVLQSDTGRVRLVGDLRSPLPSQISIHQRKKLEYDETRKGPLHGVRSHHGRPGRRGIAHRRRQTAGCLVHSGNFADRHQSGTVVRGRLVGVLPFGGQACCRLPNTFRSLGLSPC